MKKLKTLTLLFVLTSFILLNGCKPKPTDPTVRDFIKKTWKAVEVIQTVPGNPPLSTPLYKEGTTPILEEFNNVRISFVDDTNYEYTNVAGVTTKGTYAFSTNETAITFTGGGLDQVTFNIDTPVSENLTASVFNVNYSDASKINKTGIRTLKIKHVPA